MILDKYRHLKTPDSILISLEEYKREKKQDFNKMDFTQYIYVTAKGKEFLSNSIKYKNEKGEKSNVIPFQSYFPTFESMDQYRKNFYFYWRNEATKGNFIDTELSYIFLFIYELINYGYNNQASFNASMMDKIYEHYVYRYPKLKNYLPTWISDFLFEVGEKELSLEWSDIQDKAHSEYEDLAIYKDNIKSMSMNVWRKYIKGHSKSKIFNNTKYKQKIYNNFKEITSYIHEKLLKETEGAGIFDLLFPYKNIPSQRKLYENAIIDRPVCSANLFVKKRVLEQDYCYFLTQVMYLSENILIKNENIEESELINIDYDYIDNSLENEFTEYLKKTNQRFKKVKSKVDSSVEPLPSIKPEDIKFNFDEIENLKNESNELINIFEEKYGEEEQEPLQKNKTSFSEGKEENRKVKTLNNLFSSDENLDIEGFKEELTSTESEFLLLYKNKDLTVTQAKEILKSKGIMFGTFLITLNDKSEEFLEDVILEESDGELILTEELKFIIDYL